MAQKLTVFLAGRDEPLIAEVGNPDRIKWDMTATKHKWPKFTDAPFLGLTFLAWAALRRTGQYSDNWEQFRDTDCIEIETDEAEDLDQDETENMFP